MVQGEVLKKAEETAKRKDSIQYLVTNELVEAMSSEIISDIIEHLHVVLYCPAWLVKSVYMRNS